MPVSALEGSLDIYFSLWPCEGDCKHSQNHLPIGEAALRDMLSRAAFELNLTLRCFNLMNCVDTGAAETLQTGH